MVNRTPMTVRLSEGERAYLRRRAEVENRSAGAQLRAWIREDRERREDGQVKEGNIR